MGGSAPCWRRVVERCAYARERDRRGGPLLAQDKVIARAMPQGDILGFAPPFCLTRAEADTVVAATRRAVEAVLG